jgi:2-polyprenyl-3-methyl-5-hydroxy-6-metoxy-1,4-benzoquinol methylase
MSSVISTVDGDPCQICEERDFQIIGELDRHQKPLATVVCRKCGLVRHQWIPSQAALKAFYATQYRQRYHGEERPSPRRVMRAWKVGERLCRQLRPFVQPPAGVLDIGAGIGCLVKAFQRQGYRAAGIEPHHGFRSYGEAVLDANLIEGELLTCRGVPPQDLVLLVHVIEHFPTPRQALQRVHSLLRPGGLLYMECPNLGAPFAMRHRLFHFAHIHNFTSITLNALAARCGFELVSWQNRNHPHDLAGVWRRVGAPCDVSVGDGYQTTCEALQRYNVWTYHLRANYLMHRLKQISSYVHERCCASRFVRRLVRECQRERLSHRAQAAA